MGPMSGTEIVGTAAAAANVCYIMDRNRMAMLFSGGFQEFCTILVGTFF